MTICKIAHATKYIAVSVKLDTLNLPRKSLIACASAETAQSLPSGGVAIYFSESR